MKTTIPTDSLPFNEWCEYIKKQCLSKYQKKTMEQIRVIVIDSEKKEIYEYFTTKENLLKDSYKIIGCKLVESILQVDINQGGWIMADEEGLFKENKCGFVYNDIFVYGNAVVWGVADSNGDTLSCEIPTDMMADRILFIEKEMAQSIRYEVLN